MRIRSFLPVRVSLNRGPTSREAVCALLPTFRLHLVAAINILSPATASLGFCSSGDLPAPSCAVAPPCMLPASDSLAFSYHVSMGMKLRAAFRSSGQPS